MLARTGSFEGFRMAEAKQKMNSTSGQDSMRKFCAEDSSEEVILCSLRAVNPEAGRAGST